MTIRLTLAHDLLLLSLDPETGARRRKQQMGYATVGALLAELALAGRVAMDANKVEVVDPTPVGSRRADDLLARLMQDRERTPKRWVEKLHSTMTDGLLDDLVTAELVRRERTTMLGFIPTTRYPQVDGARGRELVTALRGLFTPGATPVVARTVALASLVVAGDLHPIVFPGESKRELGRRLKALDDTGWASEGVRRAIDAATSGAAIAGAAAAAGADAGAGG